MDPIQHFLGSQRVMILDGGLATELEARGCDLSDDLWSARVLIEQPERIRQVHLEYLSAGADCIISSSYQATFEGLTSRGLTRQAAVEVMRLAVGLALQARDEFWSVGENRVGRLRPLVAASVGPYGAYLADGSEFRGNYCLSEAELLQFHRDRWQILATSGADLLACETLPSRPEARALRRLLEATPGAWAWFSFSCADAEHLNDGTSLEAMVRELDDCPQIVALGINCTAPQHIAGLLTRLRKGTEKPAVVYPNSGEEWDGEKRIWVRDRTSVSSWVSCGADWLSLGARLIGGCCRTTPRDIGQLRRLLRV